MILLTLWSPLKYRRRKIIDKAAVLLFNGYHKEITSKFDNCQDRELGGELMMLSNKLYDQQWQIYWKLVDKLSKQP